MAGADRPLENRPNILVILPDQWRGDWVHGMTGVPVRTPNIDRLIAGGVSFRRAWTPSPICSPARACLALGRDYDASPVRHNRDNLPPDARTFYRLLLDSGYRVANIGKSDLLKQARDWGVDGRHQAGGVDRMAAIGFSDGFDSAGKHDSIDAVALGCVDPYTDMLRSRGLVGAYIDDFRSRSLTSHPQVPLSDWLDGRWYEPVDAYTNTDPTDLPDDAYGDNFIGQAALRFLEGFDGREPWFMIVNFPGPHEPMDITPAMADRFQHANLPDPVGCHHPDPSLVRGIRRNYAAMIGNIDHWVGRLVDQLRAQGRLDRTLVVFSSDHGEMLGDRNLWQKEVPFEPSVNVPLVLSGFGVVRRGTMTFAPASLTDLPPTFLRMAGVPVPEDFSGHDLGPYLAGRAAVPRSYMTAGLGSWRAVSDGRFKLIVGLDVSVPQVEIQFGHFDGSSLDDGQLFDLHRDPHELTNLWSTQASIRDRLLAHISRRSGHQGS